MSSSLLCSRRNHKKDGDGEQVIMSTAAAAMRKGPWTDEEDEQLVRFVRLFGERRWDFLAKVSGLRRTGKSCRLRWVNYLHPGLRRGRITADEERRIVELHAQWGSRWSRIARSLPGRTDNEIKNFWRTRTRKKALEERRAAAGAGAAATATAEPASSSSSVTTSECRGPGSSPTRGAATTTSSSSGSSSSLCEGRCSGDGDGDGELEEASTPTAAPATKHEQQQQQQQPQEYYGSSMDQLWSEIAAADAAAMSYLVGDACWGGADHYYYGAAAEPPPASPPWEWEYCGSDFSLWRIDDQEYYKKMLDSS